MAKVVRVRKSRWPTEEAPAARGEVAPAPGLSALTRHAPHHGEHLAVLQRLAGNQAVSALVGGLAVQRLVDKDTLWDHYFDAYSARMNVKTRAIDYTWMQRFFRLEERLYAAKAQETDQGPGVYAGQPLQDAYDRLHELGFDAPAPAEDPHLAASRGVLRHANQRWNAFRGDNQLNRGAWAGSASHGPRPNDYAQTAAAVIAVLQQRQLAGGGQIGAWWLMVSDSAPSGRALHRGAIDLRGDFIYHL